MVKHTQTIRRQIADELFECVLPFCVIGAWRYNLFQANNKGNKVMSRAVCSLSLYLTL